MAYIWYNIIFIIYCLLNNTIAETNLSNERDIKGKVVIVTGGAQGIGYAIADNFLKKGAGVVILLDIKSKKGKKAERTLNSIYGENKAEYIKCDVTKDLDRVFELIILKYKYVDVLVNNAGVANESKPQEIMLTNAMAPILWSLRFVEHMSRDNGGRGGTIINIASITIHRLDPTFRTYRGSKLAIFGFSMTQGHSYNYESTGVRVITLCPGATNTAFVEYVNYHYDTCLADSLIKHYNSTVLQSPDNVGRGATILFETAESGTSWDIKDEKPPYESSNTMNVVPIKLDYDAEACRLRKLWKPIYQ